MDTVDQYREAIRKILKEYASYKPAQEDVVIEYVEDASENHFELLQVGWIGLKRIHGVSVHIDIINDKIWIQHDGSSPGIAEELVEAGVPKDAIVLGFRPAELRHLTGFAVG